MTSLVVRVGELPERKKNGTRGRPRSQRAKEAIVQSAIDLIRDKPFSALTMAEVAARAGVSTATIYRWWRTKEDLLIAAVIEKYADTLRFPVQKSPLESIRKQLLTGATFLKTAEGQLYLNFVIAGEMDPEQRDTYYQRFHTPLYQEYEKLLKEACLAGELPENVPPQLAYELMNGPVFLRALVGDSAGLSKTYVNTIFDTAVAGLWERFGPG